MNVSANFKRILWSRCLLACGLWWATAAIPCGVVDAQDLETVERRLGGIVADGELTLKQAAIMLDALKKGTAHKLSNADKLDAYLGEVWAKLQAAVAAGQMSEEDAEAKMTAIKHAKLSSAAKTPHNEAIGERLKAAVKAGKLTEEEAWAKWKGITESSAAKGDVVDSIKDKLASAGQRIKAAVESGQLSEAEAWQKRLYIKQNEIGPQLKAAVESGKLSEADATAIWREIEKTETAERLKAAVAKGEISEEEARAKWDEINRKGQD